MRSGLIFTFLIVAFQSYCQQVDIIDFEEMQYDFGEVKEEEGPVLHEFRFVNNSSDTLKIKNVKASCGCTTPDWTREAVAPGGTGFVQAQYNPRNRPGRFNKSLTVTTNVQEGPVRLYIRGSVTPKKKTIEEELATDLNGLRMKYRTLNMGQVRTTGEPTLKVFEIYNNTPDTITFSEKVYQPEYIETAFKPEALPPKTQGVLEISYDAKKRDDLGFLSDNITFYTNQPGDSAMKSLSVFATVLEYFPPMTREELDEAPKITIEEPMHDFGNMSADEKVNTSFIINNDGQDKLEIRKIAPNCDCVLAKLADESIKPGESTTLEVTFNSIRRRGNQQKSVTIYSNDPRRPVQRVTIKAYVKE